MEDQGFVVKIVKSDTTEKKYETFAAAMAELAAGDTVLLGQDTTCGTAITVGFANVTIDLAGFTLTSSDNTAITANAAGFKMKNGTLALPAVKTVTVGGTNAGTIAFEGVVFNSYLEFASGMTADKVSFKGCSWGDGTVKTIEDKNGTLISIGQAGIKAYEFVACTNYLYGGTFILGSGNLNPDNMIYLKDCVFKEGDTKINTKGDARKYPMIQVRYNATWVVEDCTFNCSHDYGTVFGLYNDCSGKLVIKGNTFNVPHMISARGVDGSSSMFIGADPVLAFHGNTFTEAYVGYVGYYNTYWTPDSEIDAELEYKNTLPAEITTYYGWDATTPVATIANSQATYLADLSTLGNGDVYYLKPGATVADPEGFASEVVDKRALSYKLVDQANKATFTLAFNDKAASFTYWIVNGDSGSLSNGDSLTVDKNSVITFKAVSAKYDAPFLTCEYAIGGAAGAITGDELGFTIVDNGGTITATVKDCYTDDVTAAELTASIILQGGADLDATQQANLAANIDAVTEESGSGKATATWLKGHGFGRHGQTGLTNPIYAEDIANAKALGLTYKLDQTGTDKGFFLFEEEPAATFTAVAASTETAGAMDVAFTLEGAKEADEAAFATLISKRVAEFAKCSLDLADWTVTPIVTNASVDENNVVTATIQPEDATVKGFTKIELK